MSALRTDTLVIDGSHGEGGGQILRTAVSLAAISGRPLRIEKIRAGRARPGLAAQHVTAVRAAAAICNADIEGDVVGSEALLFRPRNATMPGTYEFDVAAARQGGSAGAATLVLQTVTLPLALQLRPSCVTVRGGTHVPWCPSFDYFETVWIASLRRLGLNATTELISWGFLPAGGGEIVLRAGDARPRKGPNRIEPLRALDRGALKTIEGHAVVANLPCHICERMAGQASALLEPLGVPISIGTERVSSVSPGAFIFLRAVYANICAGFTSLGRRGKPAESVAEDGVSELLAFHESSAALDRHLADQMLLPLCFAGGISEFNCSAVTRHLETNAWVIEQFEIARIKIARWVDGTGHIKVAPAAARLV